MIYLDNAATSFPKPPAVYEGMLRFAREVGANPGRSGHRLSVDAGRIIYETRESLASLFNVRDPLRVLFSNNATGALNQALLGFLNPGDRVVTSGMEHNSVMRPLRALEAEGVRVVVVPSSSGGVFDPDDLRRALSEKTAMVVVNHGSNVNGCLQLVRDLGIIVRETGALFLVDAAQTAGCVDIDMERDYIDLLAFTGHKALYGPQGTGGLIVGEHSPLERMRPLMYGGTGSRSEFETQPEFAPDRFESGTPNTIGIAGLGEGVRFVQGTGIAAIRRHEDDLANALVDGLSSIDGVRLFAGPPGRRLSTVSFTSNAVSPGGLGLRLDEEFDILCRVGLHCSPAAHVSLGSFPDGTVRFSAGYFISHDDIAAAIDAVRVIVRKGSGA
ncbi:MAG TPA: aminotransferase class V-fold PLP-dependent enzyme [Spirochaetota bacterium]|nr:aminotransferase class V-fold PLP-dependent enzyme [Spirochaetota bacterium]